MNRSEAGKLGAVESAKTWAKIKEANEIAYNKSPKLCKHCNTSLSYDDFKRKKAFCNSSCSATFNNLAKDKKKSFFNCIFCNTTTLYYRANKNKYCSIKCQQDYQSLQKIEEKIASSKTMKKFLLDKYGNKCWNCGITEWNGKELVMELEHIDGNSTNNEISNLSLLCPNCHSQTPTYKGKNKGNGRHLRMKRYLEGKSY
jgi:hypothetical protein